MQNKIFRFIFFFLTFLILFQWFIRSDQQSAPTILDDVIIKSADSFNLGKPIILEFTNRSDQELQVYAYCNPSSLKVEFYENGEWINQSSKVDDEICSSVKPLKIASGNSVNLDFGPANYNIFGKLGRYKISYDVIINDKQKNYVHEIEIVNPSLIKRIWINFLYKPIFNTLIFFIAKIPGHHLGWAIIFLTLLIKLILLLPNQKALKSQRKIQKVQPQLDALKQKYKNDPSRLAQETMLIWKKHKVSPMGSCLPMLIQFPILIALFYVVRDGLIFTNPELLYEPLRYFRIEDVNFNFLNLIDLTKKSFIALPVIVAGLQFTQIRLSFSRTKSSGKASPMMGMNQAMQYFMPVMIAVFTASLPAAVGLYWGTSTLFSIGQQLVVNASKD